MDVDEIDFSNPELLTVIEEAKNNPLQPIPEMKFDEIVNTPNDTPAADDAPPADPTVNTPPADKAPATTEPNYAEWLTTKSGGLFKTEEEFVAALDKVKNYDSIEVRARELETKVPKFQSEEAEKWFNLVQTKEGKQLLKEYIAETDKDYKTMSSVDVVKELLAKEHPQWSKKEVDLEIRAEYGKQLEKIDTEGLEDEELEKAEAHNERVEENTLRLERAARDARIKLIDEQSKLTLPELKKTETAQQPQLSDADIADAIAKFQKSVDEALPKLSNIKTDIDDKGVEYVSTDDEKATLQAKLKNFNILKFFGEERGWQNPDKSWNVLKIAEDVRFLTEGHKAIKSIAGQVKTEAIRAIMAKIKGIDPNYQPPGPPKVYNTFEEAAQAKMAEIRAKQRNVETEEAD